VLQTISLAIITMKVQTHKHVNFAYLALALLDVKLVFTVSVIDGL